MHVDLIMGPDISFLCLISESILKLHLLMLQVDYKVCMPPNAHKEDFLHGKKYILKQVSEAAE